MRLSLPFSQRSLKVKLISGYLVILALGGLVTSVVGSYIVSSTIMTQARRTVDHNLATARTIYNAQLEQLRLSVHLAASGTTIPNYLAGGRTAELGGYLAGIRGSAGFDFLALAGPSGGAMASVSVVRAALAGKVVAATEILSAELLEREDPQLRARALIPIVNTPRAYPSDRTEETAGMVLMAAAPVLDARGQLLGVLYGGVLLNHNFAIVDRAWELVFKGEQFEGQDVGSVTIFQNDLRISTNVKTASGERAIGTRVSAEVHDAVLGRGVPWLGRAFVVRDWYLSGYEPIRNLDGKIIGILYAGRLEKAYTAIRDRVILSFFGIATIGFIVILGLTYYEISNITRPVAQMVAATREIAAGNFNHKIETVSTGEIALLAESFNTMLQSLRQMRADLEEWGRVLEQKVKQRTEELVTMQARVAQSERLASLGLLAAGVAHEINNPLGGILALTALTLEDLKAGDPNRENLEEVLHQSQRCRDIVRGLLEFSRQSRISTELVDLNKVIQDTLSLVSKQPAFFNVRVVKEWDPELPMVMADKSELQQVFMNILMNAAQAMDERGTVTIVTSRASGQDAIEVLVSDSGHGIPQEDLSRIFDPFFTTKTGERGTGLGLSIAYGIITSHKGTISVDSKPGSGTTFTVRIPLPAAAPEAAPATGPA